MAVQYIKRAGVTGLLILLTVFCLHAQNPTYSQLVSVISAKLPGADVSNKIISFVSWSATNTQSREVNKEFNRVGAIYQGAKLRNGSKGTIVISCNVDDPSTATIAANKDGITFSTKINRSEFNFLTAIPANANVVYDNTGAKVYENLTQQNVFISYNQLITR